MSSEGTNRSGKKRPAWLTGEETQTEGTATSSTTRLPSRARRQGPPAGDEGGEPPNGQEVHRDSAAEPPAEAVPWIKAPGAGERSRSASPAGIAEQVRANPEPLMMAFLVLAVLAALVWFLFLRDGSEEPSARGGASGERIIGARSSPEDPFGGGPVRDTGVLFGAMREDGDEAELDGAGLSWSGTVTEKEGEAGQTVTLEGPTAAQVERGFDLGPSAVETGVYAVAQDTGQVLHVTTHTFVPQEGDGPGEVTLGTVYSLEDGRLGGYAYYLDQREPGADRVTRTYVRPGESSYRVSYQAPPGGTTGADGGKGTFVPLLVGWRGFGDEGASEGEGGE